MTDADVIDYTNPDAVRADAAAQTRIQTLNTDNQLSWLVDAARLALVDNNHGPAVFRYGQTFARVGYDDEGAACVRLYTKAVLRDRLSRVARWVRLVGPNRETEAECSPPVDVTATIFDTPDLVPRIPLLEKVVTAPVLGRDGSILLEPGYHAASRVWYTPTPGFEPAPISPVPTDEEVAAALALIDELLHEFPFATRSDRAHSIALLLAPFLRCMITGPIPFQLISASTPGTGKGKLLNVCLLPALGRVSVAKESLGETEAEQRKKITANLLSGPTVVVIDNIKAALDSSSLELVLTETVWSDRLLGRSEQVELPNRAIWCGTGNNLDIKLDMARRTVNIVLDAHMERPWMRTIERPNLEGWALDNRARLVHAALTICQAWVSRGKPAFGGKLLGSYESWSQVVGGVLEVARVDGFLGNTGDFYDSADPSSQRDRNFVTAWWEKFQDSELTTAELTPLGGEFYDDLSVISPARSLGKKLAKLRDRTYLNDGVVVRFVGGRGSRYRLVENVRE